MQVTWTGQPGYRNKLFAVDHAVSGDYYFSLCRRQEEDDPFLFRLFVYCSKGWKHLGEGFQTQAEARAFVTKWEDTE